LPETAALGDRPRNSTLRLALIVILLVLVSATSMLVVVYQSGLAVAREALAQQQQANANLLYNQKAFYQDLVDQLARRIQVRNLLYVGEEAEAMAWSLDMVEQLPNAVGLALFRPGVQVLGNALLQRVLPACQSDLHRLAAGLELARPPVHLDNPELAHFDLVASVTDYDGEVIGTLFASFSLDILHMTLASLTHQGQMQRIRDGQGRVLSQAGRFAPDQPALDHQEPIPNSDWILETRNNLPPGNQPHRQPLVLTTLLITAVLVLVVGGYGWRSRVSG
jgi:hypothetical protein